MSNFKLRCVAESNVTLVKNTCINVPQKRSARTQRLPNNKAVDSAGLTNELRGPMPRVNCCTSNFSMTQTKGNPCLLQQPRTHSRC